MKNGTKSFLANLVEKVKPNRLSIFLGSISILVIGWIFYWAVWANISPVWTGFGAYDETLDGPRAKTLWDWMDLLIVPAVLGLGAFWLAKRQSETEQAVAEQRAQVERQTADEKRYQDTLETYFDRMTDLLLNYGLRESQADDEVRSIGRTQTLAVLRRLDGGRKAQIIRFLYESNLINKPAIIDLSGADLSDLDPHEGKPEVSSGEITDILTLFETDNLKEIEHVFDPMSYSIDLEGADLSRTFLVRAKLHKACLKGVDFDAANLSQVDLSEANLEQANLYNAYLYKASLKEANLTNAKLGVTLFSEADLQGANLTNTDISDSIITEEQLQAAKSLEGVVFD